MIKNDDIEQKRFIPFSAFYPFFRVLSLFPRFIPFSAFYPFFRVLSLFPRFIPFSAFYPFFRVLSLFPRFIPFSASAIPYFRNSGSVFYPNPPETRKLQQVCCRLVNLLSSSMITSLLQVVNKLAQIDNWDFLSTSLMQVVSTTSSKSAIIKIFTNLLKT